ncbi:DUF1302 family protein [Uliginosibacterium sp. sgz301328]|uniref:DUF1302 family protein n=1 Tax=Uliginosibacterium sp. sgz301328 TaxID=3243764 RepID=UPI00359E16AB
MKHKHTALAMLVACSLSGFGAGAAAQSRDSLFDDDAAAPAAEPASGGGARFFGSTEAGVARSIDDPAHWSHLRWRNIVGAQGSGAGLKWKLGARIDLDAAYAGRNQDIYPPAVRNDQKIDVELKENYVDASAGGLEWRLGKQNIVWGELVGIFVADVVSPRDMRDFLRTDTEEVRRTQWAVRVEKFSGDWHGELVWIPVQTYDNIGKPGADFFPYPVPPTPGYAYDIAQERRPERDFANGSFGGRIGVLKSGWDVAAFAYQSRDVNPTFERSIVTSPVPTTIYTPVHDRITQLGGTLSKDFSGIVFKGEGVWTSGRRFTLTRLDDDDGLRKSQSFDWALGMDTTPLDALRVNLQLFGRSLASHDASMLVDKNETGGSIMGTYALTGNLDAQLLWVTSFNRSEGWLAPVLIWRITPNTRLRFGADFFYGPQTGAIGRFDSKDRVYGELRYSY